MNKIVFSHRNPIDAHRVPFKQWVYLDTEPNYVKTVIKQETHKVAGRVWQRNEYRYRITMLAHEPLLDALTYLPMYPHVDFVHEEFGTMRCYDIAFTVAWQNNVARLDLEFNVSALLSGVCAPAMRAVQLNEQGGWGVISDVEDIIEQSASAYTDPFNNGLTPGAMVIVHNGLDGVNYINPRFAYLTIEGWEERPVEAYTTIRNTTTNEVFGYMGARMQPFGEITIGGVVENEVTLTGRIVSGAFATVQTSTDGITWIDGTKTTANALNNAVGIIVPLAVGTNYIRVKYWLHGVIFGYSETTERTGVAPNPNLVINPGFETEGVAWVGETFRYVPTPVHAGALAANLFDFAYFSQSLAIPGAGTYNFRFWTSVGDNNTQYGIFDDTNGKSYIPGVGWQAGTTYITMNDTEGVWTQVIIDGIVFDGACTLRMAWQHVLGGGATFIDDVELILA